MLGGSERKPCSFPVQQRELLLVPSSQMKPFELMPIVVTGPAGPGNVKPSVWGCDTWSSNRVIGVPRLLSKHGACAIAGTPERIANANANGRSMEGPREEETERAPEDASAEQTECTAYEAGRAPPCSGAARDCHGEHPRSRR